MYIKEMFDRDINRDIKGVIKVGQKDEENVYQELNEYVVTRELRKHFRDFFENYSKSLNGYSDKMGVWISGFFGSGKSHFLKILSYLLQNSEIEGKRAIEYFTEGDKGLDPTVIAQMTAAGRIDTDVMLFNIDSKGSSKVGTGKEAIVEVFMKVFNEMQGYCGSIPYLAEFERQMDEEGKFEEFKEHFQEIAKAPWEKKRQAFAVVQDKVVKAIVATGMMSEEAARNWCKTAKTGYELSIEKFVGIVKDYLDKKGPRHHVVFLVDEIGQYIANDTKLMLNLQTIVEDLGTACQGRAWVIVTSQQDIDSITKTIGNDFSKIQGRFDTRLSLTAANVDEVIRERILKKNAVGQQTLALLYDKCESALKNKIHFTAGTTYEKDYDGRNDFATVYPFVPYQFYMLGDVLTAIRINGASGKHLSDAARSMLALFQESAIRVMDKQEGALVPFSYFYDALQSFVEPAQSAVISRAETNSRLEPFDVEVLKVLFMIKHLSDNIKGNAENITTLMLSNIDEERIPLHDKVIKSLKQLCDEVLIQKNGEIYFFLTNEEQEINNKIRNESVDPGEVIVEVQRVIFEEIYKENKYRHSGRYFFAFNQKVDDRFFKNNQNHEIGLHIITPYAGEYSDAALRALTLEEKSVIVYLPGDMTFLEELTEMIKINKFLAKNTTGDTRGFATIRQMKEEQRLEIKDRVRGLLEDAIKNAEYYVNSDKINLQAKDSVSKINEAFGKLVEMQYNKLDYMETAPSLAEIRALFEEENSGQMTLVGIADNTPNKLALDAVLETIQLNKSRSINTPLKALMDRFMAAPYGYVAEDIEWLVAKLFKLGKVSLRLNSQDISLLNTDAKTIIKYLTKREYLDKLLVEIKVHPSDRQLKTVKMIINDYLHYPISSEDDEAVVKTFKDKASRKKKELNDLLVEYRVNQHYPGKKVLTEAVEHLEEVLGIQEVMNFFKTVDRMKEDFLDDMDFTKPVAEFFAGEQKIIWEKTWLYLDIYEKSRTYVTDKEIQQVVGSMEAIAKMATPYDDVYKLPDLNKKFDQLYSVLLDQEADIVSPVLDADQHTVLEYLETKEYKDVFRNKVLQEFQKLQNKLETSTEISALNLLRIESDRLKINLMNEFASYEAEHQPKIEPVTIDPVEPGKSAGTEAATIPTPIVKHIKKKNMTMGQLTGSKTYTLKNEKDIDRFLEEIKEKLMREISEDTNITLM